MWRIYLISYGLVLSLLQPSLARAERLTNDGNLACSVMYTKTVFPFQGKSISLEIYEPVGSGKFPLILFVHGSAGVFARNQSDFPGHENFGERTVAQNCFVTALVHYFDLSGFPSTQDRSVMTDDGPRWIECLSAALDVFQARVKVDRRRIGVHGESLGGFLAAELAMIDKRVMAVSVVSGGALEGRVLKRRRQTFPPILIQHGGLDNVVPIELANTLAMLYRTRNSPVVFRVLEGAGHYLSAKQQSIVVDRTARFFIQYLSLKTGKGSRN
jgi:dienelactone hydrolase